MVVPAQCPSLKFRSVQGLFAVEVHQIDHDTRRQSTGRLRRVAAQFNKHEQIFAGLALRGCADRDIVD